jgi:hypothetical protein
MEYNILRFERKISSEQHAASVKSEIFLSKSVKYSYFWSFLEFGEENKKCLKLYFTGADFCSLSQTYMGASYKALKSRHQTF